MNNEGMQTIESQGSETFSAAFARLTSSPQEEEDIYRSWLKKSLWSIDEFSALMGRSYSGKL